MSNGVSGAGSTVYLAAQKITMGAAGISAARVALQAPSGSAITATSTKTTGPILTADAPINDAKGPALKFFTTGAIGTDSITGFRILIDGDVVTVDPSGATDGVVNLVGDNNKKPKYEFGGDPTKRPVYYNGVGAESALTTGALDAAYLDIRNAARAIREGGFSKENAAVLLQMGVVTEARPGQTAIDENKGLRLVTNCDGKLSLTTNAAELSCQ